MEYEYPLFLVKGRKEDRSKVNVNRGEYNELEVRSEVKGQRSRSKVKGQMSKVKGQRSKVKVQNSKVKMAAEIGDISKWSKFKNSSFDLVKNLILRNIKMRHFSLKPIFATLDARNG